MKIICIGRNYAEHASELGNAVPDEPVIFMKPDTALVEGNCRITLPTFSEDLQHEVELVLHVCKAGKDIAPSDAAAHFDAIGIGIDLTARDVQARLKAAGLPWEKAKAFDCSAPVSNEFIAKERFAHAGDIRFFLRKNGQLVQSGYSGDLIFGFTDLLACISKFFTLKPGDLIFTGTPAGVGKVAAGDVLTAYIGERQMLSVTFDLAG